MIDKKPRKTRTAGGSSRSRKAPCPRCGSLDVVPILYGYPGPGMMDMAEQGKIALGGCCVTARDPRKHCRVCGEEFDLPRIHVEEPEG